MDEVISQFTSLHDNKKYEEAHRLICDAIENKKIKDPELQWRRAFVCRDLGKSVLCHFFLSLSIALTQGKSDKHVYTKYLHEGLEAAELGLKLNPDHPKCNSVSSIPCSPHGMLSQWCAIFLNYVSQLEGINKRIENSFKMKDHWMKAIAANPDDGVTLHALGRWCFEVSDMPWIKRKLAETFFSTPPTSTYEEVSSIFPQIILHRTIANNALYLAKTYSRLKQKDEAKKWCEQVLQFTADDLETEEVSSSFPTPQTATIFRPRKKRVVL
ncbi:unnamed protein product [Echinostoma caproni]|uniref:Regulator of microtubule dynamics protein 1 n=1 Tax=Echinostoma caproni TaxID=27848 RepID=A0A183A1W9_9TREM|nr:unnamed protein product [Echinostoma caproni]